MWFVSNWSQGSSFVGHLYFLSLTVFTNNDTLTSTGLLSFCYTVVKFNDTLTSTGLLSFCYTVVKFNDTLTSTDLSVIVLSSLTILWLRLAFCLLVTVRSKLSLFWLLLIMVHMVTQIYQIVFFSRFSCMFFRHWVNLFCLWLWDLSRSDPRVILWLGTFIFFLWLYLLVAGGEVELTGISLGSTNLWSWYLACMLYIDLMFRLLRAHVGGRFGRRSHLVTAHFALY